MTYENIFKLSSNPIQSIRYNHTYSELFVRFTNSPKEYMYDNVSPFLMEKLYKLLKKKNYSSVVKILQNLK